VLSSIPLFASRQLQQSGERLVQIPGANRVSIPVPRAMQTSPKTSRRVLAFNRRPIATAIVARTRMPRPDSSTAVAATTRNPGSAHYRQT